MSVEDDGPGLPGGDPELLFEKFQRGAPEGAVGGIGSAVLQHLAWNGLLDGGLKVRPMVLPDRFIDHDSQAKQLAVAGLSAKDIVAAALGAFGIDAAAPPQMVTAS